MPIHVASSDFRLVHFDTSLLPAKSRLEVWREIVSRELLPLSIDLVGEGGFRASVAMRSWGGIRIGSGIVGASINHRTREIVADENDDLVLMINAGGRLTVQLPGRIFELGSGSATLISCEQVGRLSRPVAGKTICVRFPRREMADLAPTFESSLGRVFPIAFGPMRLLKRYLDVLCVPDEGVLPANAGRMIVRHVCDMIALIIGASGEAAAVASGRGLQAGRLVAAKSFIDDHVQDGAISADSLAAHLDLAPRLVRKLFDAEGGVSGYVTRRRLENARSMLESPRFANTSIAAIAFDVGFGDLAHFNRAFRGRFDATPSSVRHAAGVLKRA